MKYLLSILSLVFFIGCIPSTSEGTDHLFQQQAVVQYQVVQPQVQYQVVQPQIQFQKICAICPQPVVIRQKQFVRQNVVVQRQRQVVQRQRSRSVQRSRGGVLGLNFSNLSIGL